MTRLNLKNAVRNAATARAVCLLLAAGASAAMAESPTVADERFVPSLTRAEVLSDLAAFKKSGVNPWSTSYQPTHHLRPGTTREEVQAAMLASTAATAALGGKDSGAFHLSRTRGSAARNSMVAASEGVR